MIQNCACLWITTPIWKPAASWNSHYVYSYSRAYNFSRHELNESYLDQANWHYSVIHNYRSQWPRGLRRGSAAAGLLGLRIWIPLGRGCLSFVSDVCCQIEVSASGWSLFQRSPTECDVSECRRVVWIEETLAQQELLRRGRGGWICKHLVLLSLWAAPQSKTTSH